jgi:hypothetical protein
MGHGATYGDYANFNHKVEKRQSEMVLRSAGFGCFPAANGIPGFEPDGKLPGALRSMPHASGGFHLCYAGSSGKFCDSLTRYR